MLFMKESTPKKNWWFSNRFFPCFFVLEKNHGYTPNPSFEFWENRWASERIPELTTDGYLYPFYKNRRLPSVLTMHPWGMYRELGCKFQVRSLPPLKSYGLTWHWKFYSCKIMKIVGNMMRDTWNGYVWQRVPRKQCPPPPPNGKERNPKWVHSGSLLVPFVCLLVFSRGKSKLESWWGWWLSDGFGTDNPPDTLDGKNLFLDTTLFGLGSKSCVLTTN